MVLIANTEADLYMYTQKIFDKGNSMRKGYFQQMITIFQKLNLNPHFIYKN